MPENLNSSEQFHKPYDEDTKRKVHKHLTDINDTISEEDMQKIKTEPPVPSSDEDPESPDDEIKKEMPTVWDIESS